MKKSILYITSLCALLTQACVTNDMLNNNFSGIEARPAPNQLAQTWTGSMSAWLVTFKINKNGEGLYCYSGSTQNGLQRVKVVDKVIHVQDGTKFNISNVTNKTVTFQAPYFGVKPHVLNKDSNLKEASPYCQSELS